MTATMTATMRPRGGNRCSARRCSSLSARRCERRRRRTVARACSVPCACGVPCAHAGGALCARAGVPCARSMRVERV
eukprot:934418-Prymnesium_polylepis.1